MLPRMFNIPKSLIKECVNGDNLHCFREYRSTLYKDGLDLKNGCQTFKCK